MLGSNPSDRFSSRKGGGQVKPVPWIKNKKHPFWPKKAINPGGLGAGSPIRQCREATSLRGASVLLELRRRQVAESGVEPGPVIHALQELADIRASLVEITIFVAVDLLILQRFQEGLTGGVVVRVALAAHADLRLVLSEHLRVLLRSILHAAIGMVHQTRLRLSLH